MRKIFAIAGIAIRNAIRSRVVLVLVGLLIAGDCCPSTNHQSWRQVHSRAGRVQILLRYTLGAVSIILSIASLWAG